MLAGAGLGDNARFGHASRKHRLADDVVDLVRAGVVQVLALEVDLRAAVLAAPSIGYSTGPSGAALLQLFGRWGIADQVRPRLVQAQPGVPVGSMVASGQVELGLQQFSELKDLAGIEVVGLLPAAIQVTTIFSGAVCATSRHVDTVRELLAFMASPVTGDTRRRHGMDPA
ncbi:MAG: hypothetical protein NVS2B4_09870 [Ramlibacter sp.]